MEKCIESLKKELENVREALNYRKDHIDNRYYFAKICFLTIENYEDEIDTLEYCLEKIKDCQDRMEYRFKDYKNEEEENVK